jgi:hypothetical protein
MVDNINYIPWVAAIFSSLKAAMILSVLNYYDARAGVLNLVLGPYINQHRALRFKFANDPVDRRVTQ